MSTLPDPGAPVPPIPTGIEWDYDRTEVIADGVVHTLGLVLGLVGATVILVLALQSNGITVLSVGIYVISLLTMLGLSAAYNLWPISPTKWLLRRFDHSAIYLLIAGTYTPFLSLMKNTVLSFGLLSGIWSTAIIGVLLKMTLPTRFAGLSIVLYLLLGWSGIAAFDSLTAILPAFVQWLLLAGGILYTVGVIFHLWTTLRFQNAIWHGFVLVAACCHYSAVLHFVMWG
jgi:hemolysin III